MVAAELAERPSSQAPDLWRRLADGLTFSRVFTSLFIVLLGALKRLKPFIFTLLVVAGWGSDLFDGRFARRSRCIRKSWIGRHDGEVDLFFASSIWVGLALTGRISITLFLAFPLLVAAGWVLFRSFAVLQLGMAGSYGAFIYRVCFTDIRLAGFVFAWIIFTVMVDPKKARREIKGFLTEITSFI